MATARTIISIPKETKAWLEGYSRVHKISIAEAIRKGISQLRKEEGQTTFHSLLHETSGLWSDGDGFQYQTAIREEWE